MKYAIAFVALVLLSSPAAARPHHHYQGHAHHFAHRGHGYTPWCGIYMRTQVFGDPGPSYNLARNWAHWGHAAFGPAPGVVVVWPHHVGKVVYGSCPAGQAMVNSGNDGNAVRTRCLPMRGVIAYRSQ
jgi:hypothetical protein